MTFPEIDLDLDLDFLVLWPHQHRTREVPPVRRDEVTVYDLRPLVLPEVNIARPFHVENTFS